MNNLKDGLETVYAKTRQDWRKWLQKNHQSAKGVWLIIYKKESGTPSVYYPEAVEEALCFGWIDSKPNKRDEKSYFQYFTKRNPKSKWSKINKVRVASLVKNNLMTPAGLAAIKIAKQNGAWSALDGIDKIVIPPDLKKAFSQNKIAQQNFEAFPKSSKKIILEWIQDAKRTETRSKRIAETVTLAAKNIRANHFRNNG